MAKTNKLAQVIRKIVREEVQREVRNVLAEQRVKDESLSLNEALKQTEAEAYPTMKTFSAADARAGFAAMQDQFTPTSQPTALQGHNGQVVPASSVDDSVTKAMTRDYSELVKRFK